MEEEKDNEREDHKQTRMLLPRTLKKKKRTLKKMRHGPLFLYL